MRYWGRLSLMVYTRLRSCLILTPRGPPTTLGVWVLDKLSAVPDGAGLPDLDTRVPTESQTTRRVRLSGRVGGSDVFMGLGGGGGTEPRTVVIEGVPEVHGSLVGGRTVVRRT